MWMLASEYIGCNSFSISGFFAIPRSLLIRPQ